MARKSKYNQSVTEENSVLKQEKNKDYYGRKK